MFPLSFLPCLVMFQKMTPLNVEATMMAFAGSVLNVTNGVIPRLIGVFINMFVGVSKDNMSNYYILKIINIVF